MSETKVNLKLNRSSILKLKTEIQTLFDNGRRINYSEVRVIYYYQNNCIVPEFKVFVSAPKRLLHHAVDRNTAKRRMREALRINCTNLRELCQRNNISINIASVHAKEMLVPYNIIQQKIVLSLQKIYDEIYDKLQQDQSDN